MQVKQLGDVKVSLPPSIRIGSRDRVCLCVCAFAVKG